MPPPLIPDRELTRAQAQRVKKKAAKARKQAEDARALKAAKAQKALKAFEMPLNGLRSLR